MHILYIHQYFKTPNDPGGTRSYWIAQKLVENGHKVTMLTSSTSIETPVVRKHVDGINVIYVRVPYSQSMSISARLKSFTSFMFKGTRLAKRINSIDLVIATSTPLTVGYPALVLKKLRNIPYIFEVRDLWPEVPIQMGGLNNSLLKTSAIAFEKRIYRNASHIITLSPGMAAGVMKYEPASKVSIIPNMAKIEEFWPRKINEDLQVSLGLGNDTFKIIHFGALGLANDAMNIIRGAVILKDDPTIEFVFIGGGATEEELKNYCKIHNLENVHFLGKFPMDKTSEIVNICDVSVVSFMDLPVLYTNSPNKLFDSLSAGKPIIVNSAGWTKELVEENKCGFYVNPNKPEELVEKVKLLQNNRDLLTDFGRNARVLAEQVYDKEILCTKFLEIIENQKK